MPQCRKSAAISAKTTAAAMPSLSFTLPGAPPNMKPMASSKANRGVKPACSSSKALLPSHLKPVRVSSKLNLSSCMPSSHPQCCEPSHRALCQIPCEANKQVPAVSKGQQHNGPLGRACGATPNNVLETALQECCHTQCTCAAVWRGVYTRPMTCRCHTSSTGISKFKARGISTYVKCTPHMHVNSLTC